MKCKEKRSLTATKKHIILCNGASLPKEAKRGAAEVSVLRLNFDPSSNQHNVNVKLPGFIRSVSAHIPKRIKDLLEISALVYAADRMIKRGNPHDLEYHGWGRAQHFVFKVRDIAFWRKPSTVRLLTDALLFVTGDSELKFTFLEGAKDIGQLNIFDTEGVSSDLTAKDCSIVLFSGGLDSLAGIIDTLEQTKATIVLVSHRANPGTTKTQREIANRLMLDYPGRIEHFSFECTLKNRATEETQRSRIFLYTSIAFALSRVIGQKSITVFENGITSINFSKRADLINSRASKTTHPKTLANIKSFFSAVAEFQFDIKHPFLFKTKTEVFETLSQYHRHNYINSTVTCTKTFQRFTRNSNASHCGGCSQCIDRRFAAFASNLDSFDAVYDFDMTKDSFSSDEAKTHLCDYIKLALDFSRESIDSFYYNRQEMLADIIDYIPGNNEQEKVETIYHLCTKHFQNVNKAIRKVQSLEDPLKPKLKNSFFTFVDSREYFKDPCERFIEKLSEKLKISVPQAFSSTRPRNENELNDVIQALLNGEAADYQREFPVVKFSFSKTVPDHSFHEFNLFIESKYIRGQTTKSMVTEGIAADMQKYPKEKFKLFVVYDPERKISDDAEFARDIENDPNCKTCIVR